MGASFREALLAQDDPETVRQALPAYLMAVDGLIMNAPNDAALLGAGARLHGLYSLSFTDDRGQRRRHSARATDYADRLLCEDSAALCGVIQRTLPEADAAIRATPPDHAEALYVFAQARAAWLAARTDDWEAIALLPVLQSAARRLVEIAPDHDEGGVKVLAGAIACAAPGASRAHLEEGRALLDSAFAQSGARNLGAPLKAARYCAAGLHDRKDFEERLSVVVGGETHAGRYTLSNALAQREAEALKGQLDELFPEP